MTAKLQQSMDRILFSNQSGDIAEELFDLLLRATRPGFDLDSTLRLIYPRMDHPKVNHAQYADERQRVLGIQGSA